MDTQFTLQTLVYKNRIHLMPLFIVTFFLLFFITFLIHFSLVEIQTQSTFLIAGGVFILEIYIVIHFVSALRFVPSGKAIVTDQEIIYKEKLYRWKQIHKMHFYYRGDHRWSSKLPFMQWLKSYNRYHNLHWQFGIDNEKFLDKIEIDGEPIYFKIRNAAEKDKFFKLKEYAEDAGVNVIEERTEFTYKLFGRKFES